MKTNPIKMGAPVHQPSSKGSENDENKEKKKKQALCRRADAIRTLPDMMPEKVILHSSLLNYIYL